MPVVYPRCFIINGYFSSSSLNISAPSGLNSSNIFFFLFLVFVVKLNFFWPAQDFLYLVMTEAWPWSDISWSRRRDLSFRSCTISFWQVLKFQIADTFWIMDSTISENGLLFRLFNNGRGDQMGLFRHEGRR